MNAIAPVGISASAFLGRGKGDLPERRAAAAFLTQAGLPRAGVEAWKYTSLRTLADVPFATPPAQVDAGEVARLLATVETVSGLGAGTSRIVLVNGRLDTALSRLPQGVRVEAFAAHPAFADWIDPCGDVGTALNTVMAEDGAVIHVDAGVDAGALLLVSIGISAEGTPISFHPRHRIILGAGARLAVLEAAVGTGSYLHNPVFEVQVADGARLTHARLQAEGQEASQIAVTHAQVASDGLYDSFNLTLGAALSRHEVHAALLGERACVHVNGAQLLDGKQHGDLSSIITHAAPNCVSRQTVKNVLAGHARGVFQGKIHVERIAQKTDGYQMNQALLLSDTAEIDAKPELEIYADDVKCSHGATVGAIDPDQLFYLRSRGIALADARSMLIRAFLHDVVHLLEDTRLRDSLDLAVEAWWNQRNA
ncbi:Fe-S cluster assembly protein SufD [Gluconacetobacter entanii]|uniref:Fe-S cluster assembly protein SufD n=1 Tax=Gluconacetobacter entanii TaxID=108528 RepID=A0A318PTH6_9PROT|nr:Fe-S cluster assembly protein SufD [Gluconacetobacter entanii]MCE2577239.1 Fe-S cluster assembly protein SufD [Komagataeibacter sp. FNDCR1]PYD63730.1 Fe-S cluster assembly protein SufD [Gluconacetobacter entanii]